jgi:hypothetical protein
LIQQHAHSVNPAVNALSTLPATAKPFAATKGMHRFLNHEHTPLCALIEPAQEAIRDALAASNAAVALVVHDWCMFSFTTHTGKRDRYQRSHDQDLGYELGSALVLDAADGRPLGPAEFRLRTATGMLATRPGGVANPPAHIDELADVFADSARWNLGQPFVHIVDREADSVLHYRRWHAAGHRFLVRANGKRRVEWHGAPVTLQEILTRSASRFRDDPGERPIVVETKAGPGRVQLCETTVVLNRPAKTMIDGTKTDVPGVPLPLRLVMTRVLDPLGVVRAEWFLLTNVPAEFSAATVARWYAWRWRIESYHKLLKTAGMNAEEWQQESGAAFAKRLVIASMACLTVWHLQRDPSEPARKLKAILIRLSGRQMKRGVADTAPALLAGLEKLLAVLDLLESHDLNEVLELARHCLPKLFSSA